MFTNNKKQLLEKERNYYKFINILYGSMISNIHTTRKTIKLYFPKVEYKNNKVYIEDYNYIIKVEKDIFPKLEIYEKAKNENINVIMNEYHTNIGGYYDYYISWYYYFLSISKFISNSIS